MSTDFYCKICDIACTGKAPYEQHLNSIKHLKKAKLSESQTFSEKPISTNSNILSPKSNASSSSTIPTTVINNPIIDDPNILSTTYSISPETMRILLEWNHPLGYKPYCDVCQLPLHGGNNADIHFLSSNNIHNQKLNASKEIRDNNAKNSCKICSELFPNENVMRDHFESISHANMIQQKNNLQKFIKIYEAYQKLKQIRQQSKETNSIDENIMMNKFQNLNIIDATKPVIDSPKDCPISPTAFTEVMNKRMNDDDDDDW